MKLHTFRLTPGKDIKTELEKFAKNNNIQAGFIVTCVGGLSQAKLRMAGAKPEKQDIRTYEGDFEITSLVGTLSVHGMHVHMAISDKNGQSFGGHLKGAIVHPTAEVVIGEDESAIYTREPDSETGFDELKVTKRA